MDCQLFRHRAVHEESEFKLCRVDVSRETSGGFCAVDQRERVGYEQGTRCSTSSKPRMSLQHRGLMRRMPLVES